MYTLPYGQMSHWGKMNASYVIYIYIYLIIIIMTPNFPSNNRGVKKCTSRKDVPNLKEPWPFKDSRIIEIIYGSLLGDSSAEKRKGGKGTRITFYQEGSHDDYLLYLHSLIANLGFCNTNIPKLERRLGTGGKIRKIIRFSTWTYDQFNNIEALWYLNNPDQGGRKKRLPSNLDYYLTPLALSIWIMDDGGKVSSGLKLSTNNFTLKEVEYLTCLLKKKYNLDSRILKTGVENQNTIYITSKSMPILVNIVKPYIIPSMKYKFGKYI